MERNNLFVFILMASLVVTGWYWFVHVYNAPTEADKLAQAKKDDKLPVNQDKEKDRKKTPQVIEEKKPEDKVPEKVLPLKKATLGGPGFHLTVDATSRGAGIRKVTLNHFQAANWRGEHAYPERNLELIQDDEYSPSFRMYHYLEPNNDNPVFGLGEKVWAVIKEPTSVKDKDGAILYDEVIYSTTVPDLETVKITKTYRLAPKEYHISMLLEITDLRSDRNEKKLPFRYQLTGGQGLPIEGEWYTSTFRNAIIALVEPGKNVWRTLEESARISARKGGDRFPEKTRGDNFLQYAGVANQYFGAVLVVDDKQPLRDQGGRTPDKVLAWARPTLETQEVRGIIRQIANGALRFRDEKKEHVYHLLPRTDRHFKDLELDEGDRCVLSYYETPDGTRVATWVRAGDMLKPQFDDITMRVNSEVIDLWPGEPYAAQFKLYHGPVKTALLGQFSGAKEVPAELVDHYTHTHNLRTLTDYHYDNWFGKISSKIMLTDLIIQFTRLMHWLLHLLQGFFGHGLSIVVLTVIVRACMFFISRKQALFSIKMQELAPELKRIQDQFPNNPQEKMKATQEFYRKHGINPLGSCWPVFLQMPIFLGLYFALQESIHFRLAGFLWIENLSAPDMLLYWTESIPLISTPDGSSGILGILYLGPYLNVLPIAAMILMMIQQLQTMPPPTDDQQAAQQKMLKFMTIFFGIMFYKVAAGLCIYFTASSLWGMAERKLLPKKKATQELPTALPPQSGSLAPKGPVTQKNKGKWNKKDKDKDKTAITAFDKLKELWREILKQAEKK